MTNDVMLVFRSRGRTQSFSAVRTWNTPWVFLSLFLLACQALCKVTDSNAIVKSPAILLYRMFKLCIAWSRDCRRKVFVTPQDATNTCAGDALAALRKNLCRCHFAFCADTRFFERAPKQHLPSAGSIEKIEHAIARILSRWRF